MACLWAGPAVPARASCAQVTAADLVRDSDVVVVGTVTDVDEPSLPDVSPHPVVWAVEVESVLKGEAPRDLYARSDSYIGVTQGVSMVLPLSRSGSELVGDGCSLGVSIADVTALTGPGHAPSTAAGLPGSVAPDIGSGAGFYDVLTWAIAVIVLGVLAAAVVTVAREQLRRRRRERQPV